MVVKNIIAYILKGEKLDGANYDIWHQELEYLLNTDDTVSVISETWIPPVESASNKENQQY